MKAKIFYLTMALVMALALVAVAVPMPAATPMTTPAEAAGTTWEVWWERLTTDAANEYRPAVSADGSQIAYYNGSNEIWVMDADGSNQQKVADGQWAAWMPVTGDLTYVDGDDLYLYVPAGADTLLYTHVNGTTPYITSLEWSPDESQIAITGCADGHTGKDIIWLLNTSDWTATVLYNPATSASYPTWSPDGSKVAFTSRGASSLNPFNIWSINSDTSGLTQLTTSGGLDPNWSPALDKIIYEYGSQLWVMDGDGSDKYQLTNACGRSFMGKWSPGSTHVVLARQEGDRNIWAASYPCASIQCAIAHADPGDTVVVHEGKYCENLHISKSLTLMAAPGEDVELDNPDGHGITISGAGHVTVQGLEIYLFPGDGIHINNIQDGGSVAILDCFIHDNGGAGIAGDDLDGLLTIDGNIIADNGDGPKTGVYLMDVGGPSTGGTVVISNNVIGAWYDTETEEYDSGNSGDGIKIENIYWMSTVTIGPDNIIAENERDGIKVDYVDGSLNIVGNNIGAWDFDLTSEGEGDPGWVDGNGAEGIDIWSTRPGSSVLIQDNKISENGCGFGGDAIEFTYIDGSVDILDNIIGAWTYYEGEDSQRFDGNCQDGIEIDDVDGTVLIDGNKIAENGVEGSDGIYINDIQTGSDEDPRTGQTVRLVGSVTISNNYVGNWSDGTVTYGGNQDAGIYIDRVSGGGPPWEVGATLTIGPDNTIADNGWVGIYLEEADGDADVTIFENTILRNGTDFVGIWLYESEDVTVDGNVISEHEYGILVQDSAYNAIIHNTITDNGYMDNDFYCGAGIKIDGNSHHNGIVGNLIADNTHGILVYGDQNDILSNVITGNLGSPECFYSGVHFFGDAYDNVLNLNNIVGNSDPNLPSYGVFNDNDDEMVDARWNWWGHETGPYHGGTNPEGLGDSVSNYVDYSGYVGTAFPYDVMPYDADAPQILTTASMPDMHSWYSILEAYTGEWDPPFQFEEEFGFTPGPTDGMYLVETSDILEDGAAPRGIRYVTLDLKSAVAQLMGVSNVWEVQPPEWVKPWDQEEWLSYWYWYVSMVNWWEQMEFEKDCERPVWHKTVFLEFTFNMLYDLYFDESAGYSKLMEMLQPGEFHIGVTVEDWAGNTVEGTIEVALVDIAIPLEQGWNLRSTPIDLGVETWGGITHLGTDLEAYMWSALEYEIAYRWDPVAEDWEQLVDESILRPLEGIAIKMLGRDALGLVFDRNTTAMPTVDLHEGWNLIGLAVGPPDDPWMPVDDALISIEEIRDGVRGYIIASSPQQYLQYEEQWHWCGEWQVADDYHWYFGQQEWTYLHPADEVVEPVPDMSIGGAYWVFMEREDVLAGFSSTPVFLKLLQIERGQDLADVPRYPATTMVWYEDWADWWSVEYLDEEMWGLQYTVIEYKGAFAIADVLTFYEAQMPLYDWQLSYKIYEGDWAAEMLFWKEAEHAGVPYYTDICFIGVEVYNDIGYIWIMHVPADVPTVPGLSLIGWMLEEEGILEYKGANVPQDGINYFMQAMSKLQWEVVDYGEEYPYYIGALFIKPWYHPVYGEVLLFCEVEAYFPIGLSWDQEQPVIIWVERGPGL